MFIKNNNHNDGSDNNYDNDNTNNNNNNKSQLLGTDKKKTPNKLTEIKQAILQTNEKTKSAVMEDTCYRVNML